MPSPSTSSSSTTSAWLACQLICLVLYEGWVGRWEASHHPFYPVLTSIAKPNNNSLRVCVGCW